MSDDPRRWLDDRGDARDLERELLRSDGDADPPANARDVVWAALAARLPLDGAGGGDGGGATGAGSPSGGDPKAGAVPSATSAVLIKGGGALVLAGAVIAIAVYATRTPPSAPPATGEVAPAPTATTPTATTPAADLVPSTAAVPSAQPAPIAKQTVPSVRSRPSAAEAEPPAASSVAASTTPTSSAMPSATLDALRDEGALLANARSAVRRGDTKAALATLELARSRHPRGALIQEREVLTIEALAQGGDSDAASRRANEFLRAFPSTPHAAHVREFVR